jgi:hypothetical protein
METYINALISRVQTKIYKVVKGKAIIITRVCLVQLFPHAQIPKASGATPNAATIMSIFACKWDVL